ncbi:MAG: response regulator [Deltaproteobacteria bacterium]|jgi:putative two-component system response regulator|nr:response regulator [Deltaproteobacteria bacterium]
MAQDNKRQLIMLVDDSRTNLLTGKTALSEDYTVMTIPSGAKMFEALEWRKPDLILLDVDMPEMNGFEAIKILKSRQETEDIPVIFLTALTEADNELEGLQLGAVDYVTKPFSRSLLKQRITLHLMLKDQKLKLQEFNDNLQDMVKEKTKTIVKLKNKIITAMAEMVEGRDGITGNHIENTQYYLKIMLTAVKADARFAADALDWDIEALTQSSQLHDVGKISIRDTILKKPGKLTDEEFLEMKEHVSIGVGFIEKMDDGDEDNYFLMYAKIFAAYHHEKWDGSGYPQGLAGENIPLLGRVMAIADVYDALTSVRPYKKRFSHEDAVKIIVEGQGSHFDPRLVELFTRVADSFKDNL